MRDRCILDQLFTGLWALEPRKLHAMAGLVMRHAAGIAIAQAQIDALKFDAAAQSSGRPGRPSATGRGYETIDGIAIVPVHGILAKHSSHIEDISSPAGTSCEQISAAISGAIDSPAVNAILLDIYSPGGSVDGIADLADLILEGSAAKPIVAHCDDLCASAAYWIASQCNTIYCNETAEIGSIGIYTIALDQSRFFSEELLTTVHVTKAGNFKAIGHPGTEITEEQLEELQQRVDATYDVFISHIARGLQISKSAAARSLGDGRVHIGADAKALGMVDGIQSFATTLQSMINEFTNGRSAKTNRRAASSNHSAATRKGDSTVNAVAKFNSLLRQEHKANPSLTRTQAAERVARRHPQIYAAFLTQTNPGREALVAAGLDRGRK